MYSHQCVFIKSERDELVCEVCGQMKGGMKFTNEVSFLANGTGAFQHTKRIDNNNSTDEEIQKTFDLLKEQLEVDPEYYEAFDIAKRLLKLKLANQANDKKIINSMDENDQVKEQLPYLKFYVGAALYFGFRCKQAPYLLIEISDKIPMVIKEGKKVVKLARCYLKLLKFLQQDATKDQNIKLSQNFQFIDPSIYIPKFVKALEFSRDKQMQIIETTKKLVKRMMLDWMAHGRRPSSLCGAALLISAKFHGENLSTTTVCKTVQVCDETIRKRLAEFNQTGLAQLTREQFEQIQNIETEVPGGFNDPPSFVRARKQEKELEEATMKKALQLTEILNKKPDLLKKVEIDESPEMLDNQSDVNKPLVIKEQLSDLEGDEVDEFFLTPAESEYRQKMWNSMYSDWIKIKQQQRKKIKQNEDLNIVKKEKPRKNNQLPLNNVESMKDAVKHQFKNQNLNETALNEMFQEKVEEPTETFMEKINKILQQGK